jgi:hypothetical protein
MRDRLIHLFVQFAQLEDIGRVLVLIVEAVVGFGEPFLIG